LPRSRARAPREETFVAEQSSASRNWLSAVPLQLIPGNKILAAQMTTLGQMRWAIAEGYIPAQSSFSDPALVSHETACILNSGDRPAHVRITVYFADREPAGPYLVTVPARRTLHLRFNDLERPEPIPRDTPYSSLLESDVPIVVQHTRLDSRRAEVSLLSTVAYAETASR
jgi:hypothetical protein